MKWFLLIASIIIAFIGYACLKVASDADDRSEEEYARILMEDNLKRVKRLLKESDSKLSELDIDVILEKANFENRNKWFYEGYHNMTDAKLLEILWAYISE